MGKLKKKPFVDEDGGGEDINLDAPEKGMSLVTKLGLFGILFLLPALQFFLLVW
jgi:hypothetical protein